MQIFNLLTIVAVSASLFTHCAQAGRYFNRRGDIDTYPPISSYGWVVPLQGSKTCIDATFCTSTLPPPPGGQILQYLAVARGNNNFTCINREPDETPIFEGREATLWDAAPLAPKMPNHSEQLFHTLIPQMYEFDYSALKNSSLICIGGEVATAKDTAFELFGVGILQPRPQRVINPPTDPSKNWQWAMFSSSDLTWSIYRVETAGGVAPKLCAGQPDNFQVAYAAEYWFYH